jgi:hypothetical protein
MAEPWPRPFTWKYRRHWLRQARYYRQHPEVLRNLWWAHRHSKKHPSHQVWRDPNPRPRGGTACFTCDLWPVH